MLNQLEGGDLAQLPDFNGSIFALDVEKVNI